MKTFWFDFSNPPHVNFFLPIINYLKSKNFNVKLTAREFVETVKLLELNNLDYEVFGKHGGKNKFLKIKSLIHREILLLNNVSNFDFNLCSNHEAPFISWVKHKPSLVFDDNDISPNWLYSKFAKFVISPKYINKEAMYKMGIKNKQLITYNGFKENIYIANYAPNSGFLSQIPFNNFITVRPENIQASYVPKGVHSIVPELINMLIRKGFNVLYLPRYESDSRYVSPNPKLFIPDKPLNGLDVCYYSDAVLTGAGTFSREAAIIGTPAVSFFAGSKFLGVDKVMFNNNMIFYSRNAYEIVEYVIKSKKRNFNRIESEQVQKELLNKLDKIINDK